MNPRTVNIDLSSDGTLLESYPLTSLTRTFLNTFIVRSFRQTPNT
jgi:hypothetical protein